MPNNDPLTEDEYALCGNVAPGDSIVQTPTQKTLCTLLKQRQEYLEYHVPPVREELEPSPYPQYTEYQVNMRRKAEILSYKNKGDTNGSITKSQKWANLAKNPKQLYAKPKPVCPDNSLLLSLSSSCNVPGPIVILYKDPTVPLYKYGYDVPNFNLQNDVPLPEWKAFPKYDSEFQNDVKNYIANLVIQNPKNLNYMFRFQTPISVNISGNINTTGTVVDSIQLSISNPTFSVLFTDTPVVNITPIIFLNVRPITVSLKFSSPGNFNATVYSGIVNASNFALVTQPQFVYDLLMSFRATCIFYDAEKNVIPETSSNITISTLDTILNVTDVSDPNYLNFSNCLVPSVSSVPFVPFTLVGVKQ
jgi:hypothetical protein